MLRDLPERDARDVAGRLSNGAANVRGDARRPIAHLVDSNLERRRRAIEPAREARQRTIASTAHAIDDRTHPAIERAIGTMVARQKALECRPIGRVDDAHATGRSY